MNKTLLIATTNKARYVSIKRVLSKTFPYLDIITLSGNDREPKEIGNSEDENAIIKARYYFNIYGLPTLGVDDGVYIKNHSKINSGIFIHRLNKNYTSTQLDVFNYWKSITSKIPNIKGTFRRSFVLVDGKKQKEINFEILITLTKTARDYSETLNPLNYFMIPDGMEKPIIEMNNTERDAVDELFILPVKNILTI